MYEQIVQIPLIVRDTRRPELGGREVADLVSLMDLGPTVLEAAGVEVPSYFEGRSLGPYLAGPADDFAPREYVYCEDNFSLMMCGERYKLVYYPARSRANSTTWSGIRTSCGICGTKSPRCAIN